MKWVSVLKEHFGERKMQWVESIIKHTAIPFKLDICGSIYWDSS
jgi:hypothetical protein